MYSRIISSVMVPELTSQVSSRPEMPSPELLPELGKLLQQHPRADPLQPLHNLADLLVRPIRNKQVNMVARDLAGNDLQFMLHGDLA
jgi:hypothetical protein